MDSKTPKTEEKTKETVKSRKIRWCPGFKSQSSHLLILLIIIK